MGRNCYTCSMEDKRNVVDEFRGVPTERVKKTLDTRRNKLHIAIENLERDFNAGTIARTANAFNVEAIHIVGRRQWNKRGAMATDLYMNVQYHANVAEFVAAMGERHIVGVDNVPGSVALGKTDLPQDCVLVFGSEGPGLSEDMQQACEQLVAIEQFGSTRSINVGVAAGIAMYAWVQQHVIKR